MRIRPRAMTLLGLSGALFLSSSATKAQTPSPQMDQSPGQTKAKQPWRGAPSPQTPGAVGSGTGTGPGGSTPDNSGPPGAGSSEEGAGAANTGTPPTGTGANPPAGTGTDTGAAATAPGDGLGNGPSNAQGLGGGLGGGATLFGMMGDQAPPSRFFTLRVPTPPPIPNPGKPPTPNPAHPGIGRAVAVLPSIRGFKVSENQSPAPQDRIYFSANYYDNLNQKVNERFDSGVTHLKAYRYIFGVEKTFWEGRASFGLRLPIDSLSTTSTVPGFGGTTHAAGDLAAIVKYALIQDRDAGRLLSVGLLASLPTGPRSFAGAKGIRSPHNMALQPFLGFIQTYGDFYVQGFSSVDVPMNPNDVTFMYNDIGMGYYVYRSTDLTRLITAIAPTFETHVNTPLNHRNPYNLKDPAGSYDYVDLTFGTNFQIRKRGLLAIALVEPITGPRPFTLETIVQFNLRF